jgi:predicted GNAT family acetyltransferase
MGIEIADEREDGHYAAYLDGRRVGFATWVKVKDTVILPHAEVDPSMRGQGIGSLLARRAFDDARAENNLVLPRCPFMRRWADLHPDYRDIVRTPRPGEMVALDNAAHAVRTMESLHDMTHPRPAPGAKSPAASASPSPAPSSSPAGP